MKNTKIGESVDVWDMDAEQREIVSRYDAPRAYSPIDPSTSVVPSVLSWIGLIVILWCALFALPLIIGVTLARWVRGPA